MSDAPSAPTPTQTAPGSGDWKTPVPAGCRAPARPGQARCGSADDGFPFCAWVFGAEVDAVAGPAPVWAVGEAGFGGEPGQGCALGSVWVAG